MSLIYLMRLFTSDIKTTLITLIIGFIVYKLTKFYVKVYSLPPGPFPLPFIGIIYRLFWTKLHWSDELEKIADKYGPIFTLYMGSTPILFITDIDIGKEAFRKNEFAGRLSDKSELTKLMSNDDFTDIVLADYGHRWEALRRVTHSAVLKYSTTDKLVYLVSDCVDHTIKTIVEKEGLNKPFDPKEYIYNNFLNILANSAFGKRYELEDPEYKLFRYLQKGIQDDYKSRLIWWSLIPILTKIDRVKYKKCVSSFKSGIDLLKTKFMSHYKDYNESIVRDFCDTLISAKNDALREGKESAPYLTDENLSMAIFDLFFAGTDTSQRTFIWIVFFMTYYPEVYHKLREEIETEIGDRIPTNEDRERCHYVMAVISEVLRVRNIVPLGVNHKTVVDCKIGDYNIPKDTAVTVYQGHIMHNEKYWPNPKEFRPERFLDNGNYVTTRSKAYIPFGVGRRVCLGEKLALNDLFLVVVRFIQATSDYKIKLHFEADNIELDPKKIFDILPADFTISFDKE